MTPEHRLDVLERQMKSLRIQVHDHWELLDTIASPPWKRVWFFLQGYRLWRLGRWYGQNVDEIEDTDGDSTIP